MLNQDYILTASLAIGMLLNPWITTCERKEKKSYI
jgi:hypothetical protein